MKKRIWALLLVLCYMACGMPSAFADDDPYPWAVSYTTYDVTYDAIVKMYLKVVNGYRTKNYGRHDLFNDFLYWDAPEDTDYRNTISYVKRNVGFYIDDINQDGIDELLICRTGGCIYEVFTMDNGRVRELIRGGGRYDCRRLSNGLFFRYGNSGAAYNEYETWQMNGTGKVSFVDGYHMRPDDHGITDPADDVLWYRSNAGILNLDTSKCQRVTVEEAEAWIDRQEQMVVRKRFIPFAVLEKYPDDPWDIGVLAVNNKTTGSSKIRIRKEPKQSAKVVMTQRVGTYVKVLAKEEGYYKIRIGDKEGYVQKEFLIPVTWEEGEGTPEG